MLFTRDRTINVKEYSHNSVTTKYTSLASVGTHPNFEFNAWRLAQGVAMTICSRHLTRPEYWLDHISSFLSLSNLIHSNHPQTRINSSRISLLRDFSRTTRIGEVSQGLVYLYMQNTGFPYVNDFHFFCDKNQITIPVKTSTPDFVCQDKSQSNQLCLVESKGKEKTSSGDIKSKLAKAISQCISGENIINTNGNYSVIKSLGFCSEWSDENSQDDSIFHFVDPENEVRQQDTNSAPMRFHYAAWFYMVGDFENAKSLVYGEKIIFDETNFRQILVNNENYWILRRFPKHMRKQLNFDMPFYIMEDIFFSMGFGGNIGISDKIIKKLISQEYQIISNIEFSNESTEGYESFVDGTIILKR